MPRLALPLAVLLISCSAKAQELFEFYTGARQLAMGGAYTAAVNDETSMLTNPAGLGRLRDYFFTIADPEIHAGSEDSNIVNSANYSSASSTQGLLNALNNAKGKHFHAKAQMFPSLAAPNFGIGLLAKVSVDGDVDTAATRFRYDYTNDYAGVMAFCFRFWDGIIKLGVSGKLINRVEVAKELDPTVTTYELKTLANEGVGASTTAGLVFTMPIMWLPSLAVVVKDIGNTNYTLSNGMFYDTANRPRQTQQSVDAGFSLSPILANHVRATIAGDVQGATTLSEETDALKRYHVGVELNIADFFFLRGGVNQRYWTAGVEFATRYFQLQATSYGEEVGTATVNKEDRRYVGKLAIRF